MRRAVYELIKRIETSSVSEIVAWAGSDDEEAAKIAGGFWSYRHWYSVADLALPVLLRLPDSTPDVVVAQIARAAAWDFCRRGRFDVPGVAKALVRRRPVIALAVAEELTEERCWPKAAVELASLVDAFSTEWRCWANLVRGAERPTSAPPETDAVDLWRWLVAANHWSTENLQISLDWASWIATVPVNETIRTALFLLANLIVADAAGDLPHPAVVKAIIQKARKQDTETLFRAAEAAGYHLVMADRTDYAADLLTELTFFNDGVVEWTARHLLNRQDHYRLSGLVWFYGTDYAV